MNAFLDANTRCGAAAAAEVLCCLPFWTVLAAVSSHALVVLLLMPCCVLFCAVHLRRFSPHSLAPVEAKQPS
jgi:hypothetical protein